MSPANPLPPISAYFSSRFRQSCNPMTLINERFVAACALATCARFVAVRKSIWCCRPAARSMVYRNLNTKPRQKKILFVDHTAKVGGGEIALANLIESLDRSLYAPLVILAEQGAACRQTGSSGMRG